MPMNHRILRPLARPLLLDAVPGAAAAYSLRQLSNAYTGPVVTVRRSSDDAEEDFKASEIDDGTLTAFCGAGDGLVKTWFDQSGNTGRDASQGTAANQPKIVSSGSLVTESGKAALEFDGSDDYLSPGIKIFQGLTEASVFSVQDFLGSLNDTAYAEYQVGLGGKRTVLYRQTNATERLLLVEDSSDSAMTIIYNGEPLKTHLFSFTYNDGTTNAYENGALIATDTTLSGPLDDSEKNFFIGARDSVTEHGNVAISELIIYPSDQSANRQRIEGDIAWYY